MKVLKIIGIIILVIISLIIVLLIIGSKKQYVPKNYRETIQTGGNIEAKYIQNGKYETAYYEEGALQGFGKYEIYYPKELESSNMKYPVVVFVNGSGVKGSKYRYLFEHIASWGFITIGTEEENDWNGFASEMCVRHLYKLNDNSKYNDKDNIFYNKIDFDNIGITGHSQGGVGVFNAITEQKHSNVFKVAVALSPTNKELAHNIEWDYDASKIRIPIMLLSGAGGGDDWVVTGEQLSDIYNDITNSKVMLRRKDTPHGEMLYSADGYVTAWFMYYLQNDQEAVKAFVGSSAEIFNNNIYQDQKVDLIN